MEWDIIHSMASKDIDRGVTDLAPFVNQNQWWMEYVLQRLAQIVPVAYFRCEVESSDVCCVGENTKVFL